MKKFKNKVDKIIEEGVGDNNRSAYFLVYINEKHILPKKTKKVSFASCLLGNPTSIEIHSELLQEIYQGRQR